MNDMKIFVVEPDNEAKYLVITEQREMESDLLKEFSRGGLLKITEVSQCGIEGIKEFRKAYHQMINVKPL